MPHVVNGIGTWYWGKRNIRVRRGVCESCRKLGDLRTYETTKFFVVLFLPILPLGRKRIFDECPRCSRHRVIPLAKWEQLKTQQLGGALEALRASPGDVEKTREAAKLAGAFDDEPAFGAVVASLAEPAAGNADVQGMIGEVYDHFGRPEEATRHLHRALELAPSLEASERLGVHLLKFGSAELAWPYVSPVIEADLVAKRGLAYLAVEAFQAEGKHAEALAILDQVIAAGPQAAASKDYRRYRALSEKHRESGKRVKSKLTHRPTPKALRERRLASRLPWLVGPALAVLAAVVYLGMAVTMGNARRVHVVNGIDRSYVVEIAGKRVSLGPNSVQTVTVPEGDVAVRVQTPELMIPDQTVHIRTPFWNRPAVGRTFVINPDRVALVVWEKTTYSARPTPGSGPHKVYEGEVLYELSGVDYEFQTFPQSLKVKGSGSVSKTRVDQLLIGPLQATGLLVAERGREAAEAHLRRLAVYEPENPDALMAAAAICPPESFLSTIRPLLARRPILVEVHRGYQEAMMGAHPEHDLEGEYRALLAAEPGSTRLLYLLGRVTANRQERIGLFERAMQGPEPSAWAHGAMAYEWLCVGEFEKAREEAHTARELNPGTARSWEVLELDALHALGRFDECVKLVGGNRPEEELDADEVINKAYFTLRAGNENGAAQVIERCCRELAASDPKAAAAFRAEWEAVCAYCRGDGEKYASLLGREPEPSTRFAVALTAGNVEEAAKAAEESREYTPAVQHLLVYVGAMAAGRQEVADSALEKAAAALKAGHPEERRAAAWLTSAGAPDVQEALQLCVRTEEKLVLMAAMGLRYPEQREAYFGLARKLNYSTRFPHLLIAKVVGSGGGGAGAEAGASE